MDKSLTKQPKVNLGDKRLNRRYEKILEEFVKQPMESIPATFRNWHQLKAVYRFFANPKVTKEKLVAHQFEQTINNINSLEDDVKDILLIQDTTHLNYQSQKTKELNPTHSQVAKGLYLHPTIAITPCKINLGLVAAKMWTGKPLTEKENLTHRSKRPITQKESYKWIESFQQSEEIAKKCPHKTIFNISDREADVYDLFLEADKSTAENLYFIVRAAQNRSTQSPERKVLETLQNKPPIGEVSFHYKRVPSNERYVRQEVRAMQITLDSPKRRPHLKPVMLYLVHAKENHVPKGQVPIEWLLLTNKPIQSFEEAKQILIYYTLRWEIEIFFKVLKSGCKVEEIRLEKMDRLLPSLALYMAVSCRIMFLLKVDNLYPNISCELIFTPFEWKSVYMAINKQRVPEAPPPLREIIICIAKLGGYLNRTNDPPPGPKAMWIGIQKMHMLALGFELSDSIK